MRLLFVTALLLFPLAAQAADPCAGFTGSQIGVTGNNDTGNDFRDVGIYDATGQLFNFDSNVIQYPIDVRADSWCWKGGAVHRTNDENETWSSAKHPNNTGIFAVGNALIYGMRFHNTHDAIRPARDPSKYWTVRNVWVSYNRDDCIENDWFAGGLVDNSLFDGCYVFLSSRNTTTSNPAPANTVTIQNSLIRLQDMPGPYGHADSTVLGHGPLFKYQSDSPNLVLKNNVFLMEEYVTTKSVVHSKSASFDLLGFQGSKLKECSGNVIVWTGPGSFPGNIPNDPSCVTVTTDRTVWQNARDQWLVGHPDVMRISGVDDPVIVSSSSGSTTTSSSTSSTTTSSSDTTTSTNSTAQDTEPPSVIFLSPTNVVQRKSDQVIEVAANDNVGILRVEISIDGAPYAVLQNTSSVNWTVPANPNGSYDISATAIDLSGNYATETMHVFATR
jgi:hypothetical protein